VRRSARLQSLWGGYGEIYRVYLDAQGTSSAIVKSVNAEQPGAGHRSPASHTRKCRSYDVETAWYRRYAPRSAGACRVPRLLGSAASTEHWLLLLEDLDAAGFPVRRRRLGAERLDACLAWLAGLHARFVGVQPVDLWPTGTYWHLTTRADELAAIDDERLRAAAPILDRALRACPFQTILHGDAKVANFCFAIDAHAPVAAVDYQYAGGGCGVQDVAYFLISCSDDGSQALEQAHLDTYFEHLRVAVASEALARGPCAVDAGELERAWRALYPIACADFYRFYAGWAKERWPHDLVGQQIVRDVLRDLSSRG